MFACMLVCGVGYIMIGVRGRRAYIDGAFGYDHVRHLSFKFY